MFAVCNILCQHAILNKIHPKCPPYALESTEHMEDLSLRYIFNLHCAIHYLFIFIDIYLGQHVQFGSSTRTEITDHKIIFLYIFYCPYFQKY